MMASERYQVFSGESATTISNGLSFKAFLNRSSGHGEPALLASCYRRALEIAEAEALKSIAFPCISTGVYGYPLREAAEVAMQTVSAFTRRATSLEEIIFCCFSDRDLRVYEELLARRKAT